MRSAISTGLLVSDAKLSDVGGSSATGNCTFGIYWSMGVCSSVEDVTPTLIADCQGGADKSQFGCTYTVPELQDRLPPGTPTRSVHDTLWVGAGFVTHDNTSFTGINSLSEFYVIYLSDLDALDPNLSINYTSKMVALRGKLELCLYQYNSSMQFGSTSTIQADVIASPAWQNDSLIIDNKTIETISAKDPDNADLFNIPKTNITAFNYYLSYMTFIGMGRANRSPEPSATSDVANAIQNRLYGRPVARQVVNGPQKLSDLLSNLALSMTNSYVSILLSGLDMPSKCSRN